MRVFADPVSSHTATRARPAVKSLRSDNRSHDRDRAFLRPPTGLSERYEPAASLHLILHQGIMRSVSVPGPRSSDEFDKPVVDLRFPRLLLIWPAVFTAALTVFVSSVIATNLFDDGASGGRVPGAALMFLSLIHI